MRVCNHYTSRIGRQDTTWLETSWTSIYL